jgi:hypothetical protein
VGKKKKKKEGETERACLDEIERIAGGLFGHAREGASNAASADAKHRSRKHSRQRPVRATCMALASLALNFAFVRIYFIFCIYLFVFNDVL